MSFIVTETLSLLHVHKTFWEHGLQHQHRSCYHVTILLLIILPETYVERDHWR